MEKNLLHDLYRWSCSLEMRDCPRQALSGFLHGYLSVYSMVRVYPWLEEEFEEAYAIHERIREIGRIIQSLTENKDISLDERVGYVVDLMDAYQLYSDMAFLDTALDTAYEILTLRGEGKIVLPCRTPNMCRLLCNCYYFTGEEESGLLARSLVTEALGLSRKFSHDELLSWWEAFQIYEGVIDGMELPEEERDRQVGERARLGVSVEQVEDEKIECFRRTRLDDDFCLSAEVFAILAKREFAGYMLNRYIN